MMRSEYPNQDHAQQPAAPDDKLTPGTDSKSDWFLSDFPSPSYKSSCWDHDFRSSNSGVILHQGMLLKLKIWKI